jgi:hypothetical protein
MTQSYRPIPVQAKSGLAEVTSNIWTIEAGAFVSGSVVSSRSGAT